MSLKPVVTLTDVIIIDDLCIQELIEAPSQPPPRPIIDIDLPEDQNFLTAPGDSESGTGRISNNRLGGEQSYERGEKWLVRGWGNLSLLLVNLGISKVRRVEY